MGIYNPVTNTFSSLSLAGLNIPQGAYRGAVVAPDGRIIFVPSGTSNVGSYNPSTLAFSNATPTAASVGGSNGGYSGGTLMPDGRILFFPYTATNFGIFNPITNTVTTLSASTTAIPGGGTYMSANLIQDGRVILAPNTGPSFTIGVLTGSVPAVRELCLHPIYNKY
jgi:hypothetical protein